MTDSWYYVRDGQSVGPISRAQLLAELRQTSDWRQEHVWNPEYSDWREAGSVDELSAELAQTHLQSPASDRAPASRRGAVLVTALAYAGLAVLGIVSAIAYRFMF